ncbi:MAG: Cytochrome c heme lyase subunit CcmL [Acidobacteria bacterium]|nr:Cytochrome c heme lyase subunit CcmL [Acidobacteriota bacterium]
MSVRAATVLLLLLCACLAMAQSGPASAPETQGLKAPDAEVFVGAPKGTPASGAELDLRSQQLAAQLRCPVCQGLAIADSPSEMAMNMKMQVRELLRRGYTEEQIMAYFEHSYGQFVLLKPKFQGVNSLVWILPVAALLLGVGIVMVKLRHMTAPLPARETSAEPESEDPYLARVRQLVKDDRS